MSDILKAINIHKQIKDIEILKNLSFSIPRGSIFAFLGPNGAGKSTFINILVQLIQPSSGEIILDRSSGNKEKSYREIGIVFQDNTLDDELTVYDNLVIRGSLYLLDKNRLQENICKMIKLFHMEDFVYQKYGACSGGQKRIAMIARAVIVEPSILILDEPTNALDPKMRRAVWDVILKLNRERGMTIFFSSHYLEEAKYANYICILNKGKIVFEGEKEKLLMQNKTKKLMIQEKYHSVHMLVDSIEEGVHYINSRNPSSIVSLSLGEVSLEEIFLKILEGCK